MNGLTELDKLSDLKQLLASFGRTMGSRSFFAVHNVGYLKSYVLKNSRQRVDVKYIRETGRPSYSGIHGSALQDGIVRQLIADAVQSMNEMNKL